MVEQANLIENPPKSSVTIDEAIAYFGGFREFQWLIDAAFCLMTPPRVFQVLLMVFTTMDSPWRCVSNSSVCLLNGTYPSSNEYRCNISRSEWYYILPKEHSIAVEYDLFCGNEWQKYLLTSILFVGWGVGAIVLSWISDNYGRKNVIFISQAAILAGGLGFSFLENVPAMIFFRFFIGFFYPGASIQSFILAAEYVGPNNRAVATLIQFISFVFGLSTLALKAYLIRNWRTLCLACTAPYIITLAFYKFIPESIRLLRLKRRDKELMYTLHRMAYWNKKEMPEDMKIEAVGDDKVYSTFSPVELFRNRKIAFLTLNQGYAWFVAGMVYYGIVLVAGDLGGSIYLNFALLALMGIPGNFLSMFLCNRIGRKKAVVITMFASGVLVCSVPFIPKTGTIKIFRIIFGLLGRLAIGTSFSCLYVWSVEIYPTSIRAIGTGFLQVTSRMGAASSPWVAKGLFKVHKFAPFILMCVAALIATVLAALVPETRGKPTLETNADMSGDVISATNKNEIKTVLMPNEIMEDSSVEYSSSKEQHQV